jgi:hypothetical protein
MPERRVLIPTIVFMGSGLALRAPRNDSARSFPRTPPSEARGRRFPCGMCVEKPNEQSFGGN